MQQKEIKNSLESLPRDVVKEIAKLLPQKYRVLNKNFYNLIPPADSPRAKAIQKLQSYEFYQSSEPSLMHSYGRYYYMLI